jgi:uncharacterized protein (DUF2267 family)
MTSGLPVFDTTLQESNACLKLVEAGLPPCTRQQAYGALRAVLHALRDRLPMEGVLGLSAQLPLLLRGVLFEGWRPQDEASRARSPQAFADQVAEALPPHFPRQPNEAVEAVFAALGVRLDPGQTRKLVEFLPLSMRGAWPFEHRVG